MSRSVDEEAAAVYAYNADTTDDNHAIQILEFETVTLKLKTT